MALLPKMKGREERKDQTYLLLAHAPRRRRGGRRADPLHFSHLRRGVDLHRAHPGQLTAPPDLTREVTKRGRERRGDSSGMEMLAVEEMRGRRRGMEDRTAEPNPASNRGEQRRGCGGGGAALIEVGRKRSGMRKARVWGMGWTAGWFL